MCNNEEDFCGIAKYKHKYSLVDKIMLGLIFALLSIGTLALLLNLFNPHYFSC